jgi:mannose-6-phosphate isomerase-like protein (cupin superfamily)
VSGRVRMSSMNEAQLTARLVGEGFSHSYVWEDVPNARYPNHTHGVDTAHIILSGEMTLTIDGVSKTFREGERADVPAGALHSARMGPEGCRYLIGERKG